MLTYNFFVSFSESAFILILSICACLCVRIHMLEFIFNIFLFIFWCLFLPLLLFLCLCKDRWLTYTVWKVSKYGAFSGPYFPVFGLNTEIYWIWRTQENTDQKNSVFGHFSRSAISRHWYLSIPPKIIRKSNVFNEYRKRLVVWNVLSE